MMWILVVEVVLAVAALGLYVRWTRAGRVGSVARVQPSHSAIVEIREGKSSSRCVLEASALALPDRELADLVSARTGISRVDAVSVVREVRTQEKPTAEPPADRPIRGRDLASRIAFDRSSMLLAADAVDSDKASKSDKADEPRSAEVAWSSLDGAVEVRMTSDSARQLELDLVAGANAGEIAVLNLHIDDQRWEILVPLVAGDEGRRGRAELRVPPSQIDADREVTTIDPADLARFSVGSIARSVQAADNDGVTAWQLIVATPTLSEPIRQIVITALTDKVEGT